MASVRASVVTMAARLPRPLLERALAWRLRLEKREQVSRFRRGTARIASVLERAKAADAPELVLDDWAERNRELETDLFPVPPIRFLRHPAILYTMFLSDRYLEPELEVVLRHLPEATVRRVLAEDPIGGPPLTLGHDDTYLTSSNTVHHVHHLVRFLASTGADLRDLRTVVEWGGGYGNLAKLFTRLRGEMPTYVIVDTPLFCSLQWLYLSSVLGTELAHLVAGREDRLQERAVNLVPIGRLEALPRRADLFVSTWALNESAGAAQREVVDRSWLGADHLLLGMHTGHPLEQVAVDHSAVSEPVGDFMPSQRYLFR